MKIAFLTSCAAPGKDGVGDYTRLLAQSCEQLGHPTNIVALHDRQLRQPTEETESPVPTLRLSASQPWNQRVQQAREQLDRFDPDWISVQFVPYGFHRKGLSVRLTNHLRQLIGARRRQLMLHELWIGAERNASMKHRLIGTAQRWLLIDLIHRLAPRYVHTSNQTYRALLQRQQISCVALPMFGALPNTDADPNLFLHALREANSSVDAQNRSQYLIFGLFGTLHPIWPAQPLLTHLQLAGQLHRKRILIAGIGRLGAGQRLWHELAARYAQSFDFCHLGEQPPARISAFLNGVDFGISTTPLALIGKSATTAAMLEHGLPVIVNRDDVRFANCPPAKAEHPLLIVMDDSLPERLSRVQRGSAELRLPSVTRQFLDTLQEEAA
jgi:hypothetical protein